ncbi:hypothetical protein M1L60_44505 [Actinoplanes sp. TRM 88003]|uniref:Uncharacterized protein n=1 Tax=Paractinoplanes aksuensis TaxID=2939490 RepID=A0ABT1E3F7_9ACTN|nr:hypothetical protein [Actinoplanes aksuensis]MCO8277662.1 hypothetical protein [Actinoplanes aksuensis]
MCELLLDHHRCCLERQQSRAFPLSFYNDFPVAGWHWVSLLGPYNERLMRDYGATNLALLVLTVWVWRRPTAEKLCMTGSAWLVYAVVHFLWHLLHLEVFTTLHKVGNVVSLALILGFAVALVLPDRADENRATAEASAAAPSRNTTR